MEFSGLYSLVYTAFNYYIFPASITRLAGESKSKIKPDKVYYCASIHDSQTFLRLLSPKKCWSSWTDPLSSPYAATLTKIVASRSPLKITYIKDEYLTLSKIISFRQRHIAQHRAAVAVRIVKASCALKFWSQFPSMWVTDLGGAKPVATWRVLQITLACWQSKKRCLIVSLQMQ